MRSNSATPSSSCASLSAFAPNTIGFLRVLHEWRASGAPGEDRAVAANRIEAAWRDQAPLLDLSGLGLRSFPFRPNELPFVTKLSISHNPALEDLDLNWAEKVPDIVPFLNQAESASVVAAWADGCARSDSIRLMRIGMIANLNLGYRLLRGEVPDIEPMDARAQALKRFGMALWSALALQENVRIAAEALLMVVPPEQPFADIDGFPLSRADLEGLAKRELPVGNDVREAHLAHHEEIEAVMEHVGQGWGANVHFRGLLSRGAAIMVQIRTRIPMPMANFTDTCRQIQIALKHDPSALRGLEWAAQQRTAVSEGALNTHIDEVICGMWAYCATQADDELRSNLIQAFARQLRDIASETPCNTGTVQRILQVPEGIDSSLMTGVPDLDALQGEINRMVIGLDAHLDEQLGDPAPGTLTDGEAEARLRAKLALASRAIKYSLVNLHGMPEPLVRKAGVRPLDGMESNELMMTDLTLGDLSTNYRDPSGLTALQKAVVLGDANAVREQGRKGADPNGWVESGPIDDFWFPLQYAASRDDHWMIDALLEAEQLDANQRMPGVGSALVIAAQLGKARAVKHLIESGRVDVNLAGSAGTALMCAAERGHVECVHTLLEAENIDPNRAGGIGQTALTLAASANRVAIVKLLLSKPGVEVNAVDHFGNSALMIAAHGGHLNTVRTMLEAPGVNANLGDRQFGFTALMFAVANNNVDMVRLLIESGKVNVKARNRSGTTARRIARQLQYSEIVQLLSAHPAYGADPGQLGLGRLLQIRHGLKEGLRK